MEPVNHILVGIEKAAGFGDALSKGVSSMGKQILDGGSRAAVKRIKSRALWGAGIGAGGSMLQQKLRGEDVSAGRAIAGGAMGAGVGALAGTTVGAKSLRWFSRPKATPRQSFGEAINPVGWFKKTKDIEAKASKIPTNSKNFPVGQTVTKGRTAWGNLSPLDKGFLGFNAVSTAKQLHDPGSEGHRGEILGGSLAMTGATLTGSRWGAMRHGGLGNTAKSLGLYIGSGAVGTHVGRMVDKKMHPEQQEKTSGLKSKLLLGGGLVIGGGVAGAKLQMGLGRSQILKGDAFRQQARQKRLELEGSMTG